MCIPEAEHRASDKEMNNTINLHREELLNKFCSEEARFRMCTIQEPAKQTASQVKKCRRNALQFKPNALELLYLPLRDNVSFPTALITLTYAYKLEMNNRSL